MSSFIISSSLNPWYNFEGLLLTTLNIGYTEICISTDTFSKSPYSNAPCCYGNAFTSPPLILYGPVSGLGCFITFVILYTVGWTPWTGDQPVQVSETVCYWSQIYDCSRLRSYFCAKALRFCAVDIQGKFYSSITAPSFRPWGKLQDTVSAHPIWKQRIEPENAMRGG
jgi:hypothetical protein